MGINTDLFVDPYYDDYDETKQFNRILFRPARAIQARELTQLQTILQNQVERFGSNIYKEGTIISGVNLTSRDDISFIKLKDSRDFIDPSIYNPTDDVIYEVYDSFSQLTAEIVSSSPGFETLAEDLKTFYIKYLNTGTGGQTQFDAGAALTIRNKATQEEVFTVTVASVANFAGKSFGVSCEEGVIYQKGHFIFVDSQFLIVSKYSNTPNNVSVGFVIQENLINSDQDSSLLDNASGFNNENAPGADRLQLLPQLSTFPSDSEPDDFFALIRYIEGDIVRLRDFTEFNVIGNELARRTYDESGNYVVSGLDVRLEEKNGSVNALVAPGKAYAFGREVRNVSTRKLPIEPVTSTQTKTNQSNGITYGSYFKYEYADNEGLNFLLLDGARFSLYTGAPSDPARVKVGTCSISNIIPGRIYVYAIDKEAGQEAVEPEYLEDTLLTSDGVAPDGKLYGVNEGGRLFDTGKNFLESVSAVSFVRRVRQALITVPNGAVTITGTTVELNSNPTAGFAPIINSNIVVIDANQEVIEYTIPPGSTNTITLSREPGDTGYIYYDARYSADTISYDTLEELDVYVKTTCSKTTGFAPLGLPNAIRILEVKNKYGGTPDNVADDITSKFKLINNQKDDYYDLSQIRVKAGESLGDTAVDENFELLVRVKVLRRTSTVGNGYLTINSYGNVDKSLLSTFESRDGRVYDLLNCYDFRPYAAPIVPYTISSSGAPVVTPLAGKVLVENIAPSINSQILATQSYYLSRIDNVVIDEFGEISIFKGAEAENPSRPELRNLYALNRIYVAGNKLSIKGPDPVKTLDVSNKTYTMKDIFELDKKVDRLVDTVSLSLLETQTKDFFIPDANGNDRFKSGILVDSCKDLRVANLTDPEFRAAVDKTRTVVTPAVLQYPLDLIISPDQTSVNYQPWTDIITVGDTGSRINVLTQPYATNFRNCVTDFYNYTGKMDIFPAFDVGYDNVTNPNVNIEIDLSQTILDLVDNIQEFVPLTREQLVSETTRFEGVRRNRVSTTTQQFQQIELISSINSSTQSAGNFITDFAMTPYVRSREVGIVITGLRPLARHYFFFEEDDVNAFIYPGRSSNTNSAILNARDVRKFGKAGDPVVADANGTVIAVFEIPGETYFVGENTLEVADISSYANISSARTSYARVTYRAYNFELGRTEVSATTRSVDFDVENAIIERQIQRPAPVDPIAQTFLVRASQAKGASCVYISDLSLYFKKKAETTGVTIELREVQNGYPSKKVLPFGRRHLTASQVNVSDNATAATVVTFDNPVKLNVEKEYCFVVLPDANSPDYLIYTSKVGGTDITQGVAITNDWGDGVLFTSTNDRAWKSYQDEDIKFSLNRYQFQNTNTSNSIVYLTPNKPEFLTVSDNFLAFANDELVYSDKGFSYQCLATQNSQEISITGEIFFNTNSYILVESTGGDKILSRIIRIEDNGQSGTAKVNTIVMESTWPYTTNTGATARIVVAGRVSYFNRRKPSNIHLSESSASTDFFFEANDLLVGYTSGATATVVSANNREISYIQPQILIDNTIKTSTNLVLYDIDDSNVLQLDRDIEDTGNVYLLNNLRTINSTSNIVNTALADIRDDFVIGVEMSNGGFQAVTPLLDVDLSMLNVYEYYIDEVESNTSKYISREVVLEELFEGEGLKVLLSAYRPAGTVIDVYARFVYPTNVDVQSDWIQLENQSPELFSNISNTKDYRDFQYNLTNENTPYSTFQIKIVLRHMTNAEVEANNFGVTEENIVRGANLFPHVYDYRAIALI